MANMSKLTRINVIVKVSIYNLTLNINNCPYIFNNKYLYKYNILRYYFIEILVKGYLNFEV